MKFWAARRGLAPPLAPAFGPPSRSPLCNLQAASPAAAQADEPTRIQVDVTRVNLLYTVTDRKGRFVTNLTKDDFEVIESKKPQNILEFNAESDLPLRLGILIDTSNSIRERFKFEQDAAIEFLNNTTPRQSGSRHAGELRHQGRTGQRPGRATRRSWPRRSAACVRAAARRSTTRSFLPAATSFRRTSRSTSSAARS